MFLFRLWPRPVRRLESRADGISDPVSKLKFLQHNAILAGVRRPKRRRRLPKAAALFTLAAGLALAAAIALEWPGGRATVLASAEPRPAAIPPPPARTGAEVPVWLVERSGESEVYSNGLRVDVRHAVSNRPRRYRGFRLDGDAVRFGPWRSDPAGIVFHSTESRQAPFAPEKNHLLRRLGEGVLGWVRSRRCYHYVVDRFGRVYRVVEESDAANHAGHSIWSDAGWSYIDLNDSFLGVSFEAATEPEARLSAAQLRAAATLTEMLRSRYSLPAESCVTHAQVSVNPSNMRVGYHRDWASDFPFGPLGLPDNYARPLPSIQSFGFQADPVFLEAGVASGVEAANRALREGALAAGVTDPAYRRRLHRRYRELAARMRRHRAARAEQAESN